MSAAGIIWRRGGALLSSQWRSRFAATAAIGGRRSIKSLIPDPSCMDGLIPADPSSDTPPDSSSSPPPLPASEAIYSNKLGNVLHMSQLVNSNGKKAILIDTLDLMMRLEAHGVPRVQAKAITLSMTEVLNDSLENVTQAFVSQGEMQMQRIDMIQDAHFSKIKSELQSSQEHHFMALQRETERFRNDIEKMHSEIRYQIDKVTAGYRLDLNLERGRIRDELAKQNAETTYLTTKLDREIHALRPHLEAAKYEVIKYGIGTLVSISAVGLAVVRILI